jgi:hypothetical protein
LAERWREYPTGWGALVFVNPPYSETERWIRKCAEEPRQIPVPH